MSLYKYFLEFLFLCIFGCSVAFAESLNQLEGIDLKTLANDKLELTLQFSEKSVYPTHFSIEAPPMIAFDFESVGNKITKEMVSKILNTNLIKNINVAEANHKTRVSIDVEHVAPFNVEIGTNIVKIIFSEIPEVSLTNTKGESSLKKYQVQSFDFRRSDNGEGQIVLGLSDPNISINVTDENGIVTVDFLNAQAPENLVKKYDVVDFGTPAQAISLSNENNQVKMVVGTSGKYSQISYQMDNQFILDIKNSNDESGDAAGLKKYVGDKISLNFQDISIRAILQIIADFSGFNLITDDTVKGSITLRLQNIPWDQALDIILRSKGLAKRQDGNVYMVGPLDQIIAREKIEFDERKQAEDLGPTKSELMQINYADAGDLAGLLKDKNNNFLTTRGSVTVDKRTNTLLVQDVENRLNEIRTLVKKLDVPVRQVQISAQVVTVSNNLEKTLGMRFGGAANLGIGHRRLGIGSAAEKARAIADAPGGDVPSSAAKTTQDALNKSNPTVTNTEGLFSDLSAKATSGGLATMGLSVARLPNGTLIDLELQALQFESLSKTIAKPNIITQNKNKASVEQGVQIPYTTGQGTTTAATTSFVTATLKMEVTPQITADDRITLDLNISNDSLGDVVKGTTQPAINKNKLETKALVDNGETIVLGGILQVAEAKTAAKVPFFGDLPIIGGLFRNKYYSYAPKELLVFLTPRIINVVDRDES